MELFDQLRCSTLLHLTGSGSYVRRHVGTVVGLCLASARVALLSVEMLGAKSPRATGRDL